VFIYTAIPHNFLRVTALGRPFSVNSSHCDQRRLPPLMQHPNNPTPPFSLQFFPPCPNNPTGYPATHFPHFFSHCRPPMFVPFFLLSFTSPLFHFRCFRPPHYKPPSFGPLIFRPTFFFFARKSFLFLTFQLIWQALQSKQPTRHF